MDFLKIANIRQSCRGYDANKTIEEEKLLKILDAGRLAPSACNSQPYHFTVCKGEKPKRLPKPLWALGLTDLLTRLRF